MLVISESSKKRFKYRIRQETRPNRRSWRSYTTRISRYLKGWLGYYRKGIPSWQLRELFGWVRRRLRALIWKMLKNGKRRYSQLLKRGIDTERARITAGSCKGYWRISALPVLQQAYNNDWFSKQGIG